MNSETISKHLTDMQERIWQDVLDGRADFMGVNANDLGLTTNKQ